MESRVYRICEYYLLEYLISERIRDKYRKENKGETVPLSISIPFMYYCFGLIILGSLTEGRYFNGHPARGLKLNKLIDEIRIHEEINGEALDQFIKNRKIKNMVKNKMNKSFKCLF